MDILSNMLIQIKNAGYASHDVVAIPYSKFKHSIADCLVKGGYIKSASKNTGKGNKEILQVELIKKEDGTPRIIDIKRVSKSSGRVYTSLHSLRPIRNGFGSRILSTPKGILIDKEAKKELVGGEVLFEIW
jgi:small subunit ribosomal protein S8